MRNTVCVTTTAALMLVALALPATAQDAPKFMQDTMPEQAVTAAFEEFQALMQDAALDQKTKELIGLGVAAQIPCDYCTYYHTQAAKSLGATEAEIKEAVAAAALVRQWSTMLNGSQYAADAWHDEVDAMFDGE